MSETTSTRCPFCETEFEVSEEAMSQAGGRVRCGACLQVFDARTGDIDFVAPSLPPESNDNPLAAFSVKPMAQAELPGRTERRPLWPWGLVLLLALGLAWQLGAPGTARDRSPVELVTVVVREDPELADVLRLDALLRNPGESAAPLPLLELAFSNSYGELHAARRFHPREYLHGPDARALRELAPGTQLQVSLTLQDPGQGAVNYSARIISVTR